MALVGNSVRLSAANPMRQFGAASAGSQERATYFRPGAVRNFSAGEANVSGVTNRAGEPNGYRHPSAWTQPQKAGSLGSYGLIAGLGELTGAGAAGKNADAALSGSGSLTGTGALIVSAVAALTGSGSITSASLLAFLNATASLSGSGALSAAITALANGTAALTGVGSVTGIRYATGALAADIVVSASEELTAAAIAAAVWDALRATNESSGSMGEALVELYRLAGLDPTKPLVVTATTRQVPGDGSDIDQTVVEAPAGTITVTRV